MHAAFGHAAAQDCAVLGSDQAAYCGSASELSLVPAGPLADHRAFLGSEKVHAHVRGALAYHRHRPLQEMLNSQSLLTSILTRVFAGLWAKMRCI